MSKAVVGSVVTFNPSWPLLQTTIRSFLASWPEASVVVWDNSPTDTTSDKLKIFGDKVSYLKSPGNLGYGTGHNAVFNHVKGYCQYFAILNPDLEIPPDSIGRLINYLDEHPHFGMASGSIYGLDGKPHAVHKPAPTFWKYLRILLGRKFHSLALSKEVENPFFPLPNHPVQIPVISGCFMLFKADHYRELGGFDERFFLYFEDYDLSLRSFNMGKSIVVPEVKISHNWERASHKRMNLLLIHLRSAIAFYCKWGFGSKLRNRTPSPK
ncbi:glycosyltransferase family 2 protein [Bdellovibrio sp. HCB274]|uniref:glycosyltransferase family 2 protein n=1 Tax=Bdellovibrio sp. HCB274 TaxID=3394361 RepID=UPI0039B615F6